MYAEAERLKRKANEEEDKYRAAVMETINYTNGKGDGC